MKCMLKSYLCIATLLSVATMQAVVPYIAFRSQSVSSDRDLVGETHLIKRADKEDIYAVFALTAEYQQSFRAGKLGRSYLGPTSTSTGTGCDSSCDDVYTITGSQVANRGATDWLADYFGLDPAYKGTFSIDPKVKTFTLDFNLYVGLEDWWRGLYFKIHAPFVHVKNELNFCDNPDTFTAVGYATGYFGPAFVPAANLNQTFAEFIQNEEVPNLGTTVVFDPLTNARFSSCKITKNGVADVRAELGRNFLLNDDYHLSIGILIAAPTGKRPKGEFLFEPVIGNGKRWELGGAFSTHYTFWRSEDEERNFGVYLDANVTHIFKGRQTRTFDLIGNPMSRYMLAEKVTTPVSGLFAGSLTGTAGAVTGGQFKNEFTTVANLTTQDVKVSNGVQADVSLLFNYTHCNWSFDLGYNLWATTCEKIESDCGDCTSMLIPNNTWALKGDAAVYGFSSTGAFGAVALSATENTATLYAGTNYPITAAAPINANGYLNAHVDNAAFAFTGSPLVPLTTLPGTLVTPGTIPQLTSAGPIFINQDSVDFESARTKGLSNKVFGHISYCWNDMDNEDCCDWIPFLGIGGNVEFGSNHNDCNDDCTSTATTITTSCDDECRGCERHSLTQWGIWIKGGLNFN